MAIAPQWDDAEPFAEGLAAVGNRHEERDGGVSQTVSREGWIDRTDDTSSSPTKRAGAFEDLGGRESSAG